MVSADDLIQNVQLWNDATDSYYSGTTQFNRFCSGDLPATSALFNSATGVGTTVKIYLTGEEVSTEGRAVATLVTGSGAGTAFELPSLGNLAYENIVANPLAQDKTVIALTDDGNNGQVYIYVGQKQASGTEIEKAGLSGGDFYGIKVAGITDEANGTPVSGTFTLQEIGAGGNVSNLTGAQIDAESEAEQVTSFLRPRTVRGTRTIPTCSISRPPTLHRQLRSTRRPSPTSPIRRQAAPSRRSSTALRASEPTCSTISPSRR